MMIKIEIRSNQTRAVQRPPLFILLAESKLLLGLRKRYPRRETKKTARPSAKAPPQPKPAAPVHNPLNKVSSVPEAKPAAIKPAAEAVSPGPVFRAPPVGRPAANGENRPFSRSQTFRSSTFTSIPSPRQPIVLPAPVQDSLAPERPIRNLKGQEPKMAPPGSSPETKPGPPPVGRPALPIQPAAPQPKPLPTMTNFLQRHPELPAQTALLGICEDGLPVLLDLFDPTPGALISMGDEREKQIELLRSAIASIVSRNTPRGVQFVVLSCDAHAWREWIIQRGMERYCLAVEDVDGDLLREWLLRLADWTEQRRLGQRSGPPVLLVMDTLSFLPRISYDVRLNFEWMVREGPQAQIWPLAAISTELARLLQSRRMLRAFQTRILGQAENPAVYADLAGAAQPIPDGLTESGRFAVRVGENWLRFNLFGGEP